MAAWVGDIKSNHVFAALLQQLGSRLLDVSDHNGIQETFRLLAANNPAFMAGFVFVRGECVNLVGLLQRFQHDGVLVAKGVGLYEINREKLAVWVPDTKVFKNFRGIDALMRFSLPAEKEQGSGMCGLLDTCPAAGGGCDASQARYCGLFKGCGIPA